MRSTVLAYCAWLLLAGVYGAAAETLPLPPDSGDLVGEPLSVAARHEDTLIDIARRHGLGYEEIVNANPGVDPWLPGAGVDVALPTRRLLPMAARSGIVINLPEHRLYYFPPVAAGTVAQVRSYPVSIGKMDWNTPLGSTRIVQKVKNPPWYPPKSVRDEHAKRGDVLCSACLVSPRVRSHDAEVMLVERPDRRLAGGQLANQCRNFAFLGYATSREQSAIVGGAQVTDAAHENLVPPAQRGADEKRRGLLDRGLAPVIHYESNAHQPLASSVVLLGVRR